MESDLTILRIVNFLESCRFIKMQHQWFRESYQVAVPCVCVVSSHLFEGLDHSRALLANKCSVYDTARTFMQYPSLHCFVSNEG